MRSNRRVTGALVGRDGELAALIGALDGRDRLVALVGPPGVGKTRLARAALERVSSARRTVWVDARAAGDAAGLIVAIAHGLDVAVGAAPGEHLLVAVADALDREAVVLLVDELDVLGADGAGLVAALSDGAARADVWCTSRERLGAGERVFEVRPLALTAATALFATAFRRASPQRPLAPATAREIAALSDRLPLALELAAARAASIGPIEVLEELRAGGGHAASLGPVRDALELTLRRLPEPVRAAFAAAAVFDGGFDAAAAGAVLPVPEGWAPLDVLKALCDASLLTVTDSDRGARFDLLTVVQAHAETALMADPTARERHTAHFARLAAVDTREGWAQLKLERRNLTAAWHRALTDDASAAGALAVALDGLLLTHGPAREHERVLTRTLALGAGVGAKSYAELLRADGRRLAVLGMHRAAAERLAEARTCAAAAGLEGLAAICAATACYSACCSGELELARRHGDDALAFATRLRDPSLLAYAETMLGQVDEARGDLALALERQHRAAAFARQPRAPRLLGIVLSNLASAALANEELDAAVAANAAARHALSEADEQRAGGRIAAQTAELLHRRGRSVEAFDVLAAALPLASALADLEAEAEVRLGLAALAGAAGRHREARVQLELAAALAARTDHVGLQRRAQLKLREAAAVTAAATLRLTEGGTGLTLSDGSTVDLSRRPQLRRVLLALVRRHEAAPGTPLDVAALLEAGWPGQPMLHASGLARVYMAVRRLRALGLEGLLLTREGGYCVDPAVRVFWQR